MMRQPARQGHSKLIQIGFAGIFAASIFSQSAMATMSNECSNIFSDSIAPKVTAHLESLKSAQLKLTEGKTNAAGSIYGRYFPYGSGPNRVAEKRPLDFLRYSTYQDTKALQAEYIMLDKLQKEIITELQKLYPEAMGHLPNDGNLDSRARDIEKAFMKVINEVETITDEDLAKNWSNPNDPRDYVKIREVIEMVKRGENPAADISVLIHQSGAQRYFEMFKRSLGTLNRIAWHARLNGNTHLFVGAMDVVYKIHAEILVFSASAFENGYDRSTYLPSWYYPSFRIVFENLPISMADKVKLLKPLDEVSAYNPDPHKGLVMPKNALVSSDSLTAHYTNLAKANLSASEIWQALLKSFSFVQEKTQRYSIQLDKISIPTLQWDVGLNLLKSVKKDGSVDLEKQVSYLSQLTSEAYGVLLESPSHAYDLLSITRQKAVDSKTNLDIWPFLSEKIQVNESKNPHAIATLRTHTSALDFDGLQREVEFIRGTKMLAHSQKISNIYPQWLQKNIEAFERESNEIILSSQWQQRRNNINPRTLNQKSEMPKISKDLVAQTQIDKINEAGANLTYIINFMADHTATLATIGPMRMQLLALTYQSTSFQRIFDLPIHTYYVHEIN